MIYKLIKRIIERGGYDHAGTAEKLNVFLAAGSITQAEFDELTAMMEGE